MALLRALLHKFSANDTLPEPTREASAPVPEPACLKQLQPLVEGRQLLSIRHRGRDYQSLILALDPKRRLVWLDEPFPRLLELEPGDPLTVRHHHQGQLLEFTAPLLGWSGPNRTGSLSLPMPTDLYQGPRRRDPRLDVFGWYPISARLAVPGLSPLSGEIHNLSAGGLRLALSGDWRAFLRHGDVLPLCQFAVEPGLFVRCRVRVCAFNLCHRPWRQTRLSLAFVDLPQADRTALARFVARHQQSSQRAA